MIHRTLSRLLLSTATLGVLVSACSDNAPSAPDALTSALADSVAESVVWDVGELGSASTFEVDNGILLSTASGDAGADVAYAVIPGCTPTLSPLPVINSDADGVPDSLRVAYTTCNFTRGAVTHEVSGTLDVIDPTPLASDRGIRFVYTDLSTLRTNSQTSRTIGRTRNGARTIVGTADTLTHVLSTFSTQHFFGTGQSSLHVADWTGVFRADVAGTISPATPLPAGTFTLNGSSQWTKTLRTWLVAVSTRTGLHYNPTCTVEPRLDAGVLVLVVTRDGAVSTLTVTFTGCGTYTAERS